MAETKICGISTDEGLAAALEGRARFIGFMFFARSPRNVSLERAKALAARAHGRADTVAVTVDADDGLLGAITAQVRPDWLQLHGAETPARVEYVRQFAKRGVIKVASIARSEDLAQIGGYEAAADMLLFDAKAPADADRPGGNGRAFDWKILNGRRFAKPWMLSGGLDPENVGRAIRESGARIVDVSSGVESAPGIKDASRIAAFLRAASSPDE